MSDKTIEHGATGVGLATISRDGTVLDTWFPAPNLTDPQASCVSERLTAAQAATALGDDAAKCIGADARRDVDVVAVRTVIKSLRDAPVDAHDVYLRLHLLSHRLIRPHQANLTGIFGLLANVAWTTVGPCPLDQVDKLRIKMRVDRLPFDVKSIDKFPPMTDYVIPSGVRIADAGRVRLGAYLAPGTTVMHEGFCNFNAGTLGTSMVEGRISAGVVVGDHTDIGGSASIMGTLSGGGKEVVAIGERCLLGANSGVGISLGNDCVVEAGCYITAGSRVKLQDGEIVKAAQLSGQAGVLFRRHSQTGALEALPRTQSWGGLNPALHATP